MVTYNRKFVSETLVGELADAAGSTIRRLAGRPAPRRGYPANFLLLPRQTQLNNMPLSTNLTVITYHRMSRGLRNWLLIIIIIIIIVINNIV